MQELTPRARDQPRVTALTHPSTKELQTTPQEIISIVTKHYELEQKRATPEHLPEAPWTKPQNPNNFTMSPPAHIHPQPRETLDTYITKSQYDRAINRALPGKALGPDAITSELIKHLPEERHSLIFTLFQLMAKHNYTPVEW